MSGRSEDVKGGNPRKGMNIHDWQYMYKKILELAFFCKSQVMTLYFLNSYTTEAIHPVVGM